MKFTEIKVEGIEGNIEYIDLAKQIGNILYTQGMDVEICDAGRSIYHGEDVKITAPIREFIKEKVTSGYPYLFKKSVEDMLDTEE